MKKLFIAVFTAAACSSPAFADPLTMQKGYAALQSGNHKAAAVSFCQIIDSEPKNTMARRYLACALTGMQRPDQAMEHLRAAQAIDGIKDCDAAIEFGITSLSIRKLISTGDLEKARKLFATLPATNLPARQVAQKGEIARELKQAETAPPAAPTAITFKG
jgi:tetratricopeptide (TPR) repeat protein